MQRAAASSATNSPQNLEAPPSKRQKLSISPSDASPSDPRTATAAVGGRDSKSIEEAVHGLSDNTVETKWFLSFSSGDQAIRGSETRLQVRETGYSDIDHESATNGSFHVMGRRSFGNFNKKLEVKALSYRTC